MKKNKIIFNILKGVLSVVLIYFLFKNVNIHKIIHDIKRADLLYFTAAGISFIILQQLFFILRWRSILHFNSINISFWKITKYHYISILFQTFLPSGFGADAAKAVLTLKYGKKSGAVNSVLIARGIGVFVLLLFAFIASFFTATQDIKYLKLILFFVILLSVIFFVLIRNERFYLFIISLKLVKRFKKIGYLIKNFKYNMDFKLLSVLFLYSVCIQITTILSFYFIVYALHIYIGFVEVLLFFPIITILVIIIPSINGIGTREYLMFNFFKKQIGSMEALGSIAVISYFIFLITAFIGLIFWIYNIFFNKD